MPANARNSFCDTGVKRGYYIPYCLRLYIGTSFIHNEKYRSCYYRHMNIPCIILLKTIRYQIPIVHLVHVLKWLKFTYTQTN